MTMGLTLRWIRCFSLQPGGVEVFLIASCYRNQDKARPDGPPGMYADFNYWNRYIDDRNSLLNNETDHVIKYTKVFYKHLIIYATLTK